MSIPCEYRSFGCRIEINFKDKEMVMFYFQIGTKEYDFHEKLFNEELNLGSNNYVSKLL